VLASGPHGCNDCEYAIDQHVSCKDEHKRQNGRARRNEGDNSEYDRAKAAQPNGPPVLGEEGAHVLGLNVMRGKSADLRCHRVSARK
jgi:hypothetical protein